MIFLKPIGIYYQVEQLFIINIEREIRDNEIVLDVRKLLFEFIDTATAQPIKAALPSAQKICHAFFDKLSYFIFELFCG